MHEGASPLDAVVIGGGVTGLALATLLIREEPTWRVQVLERDAAAGGRMRTMQDGGYRIETGPVGVLPAQGGAISLARELGLDPSPAAPAAQQRWLYRGGGLRALPSGPRAFLGSELLGPAAKLRAAAEPLVPAARGREETVHAFLARRFGHGAAHAFAEALVLGVTGGDPRELSLDALFPRLRSMERRYGSLLRGFIAASRASRAATRSAPHDTSTASEGDGAGNGRDRGLHGFGEVGMQALTDALSRALGPSLRTGAEVRHLERAGDAWSLVLDGGERILARRVAVTVPAYAAARLLRWSDPDLADALAAIDYAPIRVVGLGYDRIDVPHALDGFGFLAPWGGGVRSLGVLFTSTLFPGQAPAGKAHLRVLAGGRRDAAVMELDEGALLEAIREDLRITLGIVAEPEAVTIVDWPEAIPQYRLGHAAHVAGILERAAALPGLALAGNAYHGVGVNDSVADARRVVAAWTAPTDGASGSAGASEEAGLSPPPPEGDEA